MKMVSHFGSGEKHRHGAGPDTYMVHIAIKTPPRAPTAAPTGWSRTDEERSA